MPQRKPTKKSKHVTGNRPKPASKPKSEPQVDPEFRVLKGKGDASPRVSLKPSDAQPGPDQKDLESKRKTTDTRGTKTKGKKVDTSEVRNRPSVEQRPTAAEVAATQPIRDNDLPAPVETIRVKGEKVEVNAEPHLADPGEVNTFRRDTLVKDALRHDGKADIADAPVRSAKGGEWEQEDPDLG